jgi:hypothetical protein
LNKYLQNAIHSALKDMRREALHVAALNHRFAWAEGHSTLYRFMGLAGPRLAYVEDVLKNSRIYFSSPDQLNDPADCRPIFRLAKSLSDLDFIRELEEGERQMIAEENLSAEEVAKLRLTHGVKVEDLADSITQHTQAMLQRATQIYCLSAGYSSAQMWGYYAEGHAGVCLHFDCSSGSMLRMARRVVYSEVREPILVPISYNKDDEVADRMVFAKAKAWQHEQEYRIVAHQGMVGDEFPIEVGRYVSFPQALLTGITFGSKITDAHRSRLLEIIAARESPLRLFEASLGDGFEIAVRPIT